MATLAQYILDNINSNRTSYAWLFIGVIALIPFSTIAFLFSLPSHYDHYNPDFVEEIRPDRSEEDVERIKKEISESDLTMPKPGEGYAFFNKHRETNKRLRYAQSVTIVVLGDLGRSPRMMYHASSLAKRNVRVEIVGYLESPLPSHLSGAKHIRIHPLKPLPKILHYLPFLIIAPLKLLHQSWMLYFALCYGVKTATRYMLLQIPPSMPTLHMCYLACHMRNTRLVCDWHNTASSILALRFGRNQKHPIVRIARFYELTVGSWAYRHLAVSEAMKRYLLKSADIPEAKIAVLRDRPADAFKPPESASERSEFLQKCECTKEYASDLTKQSSNWKLVVSSTSWTADEDFGVLLDALVMYSSKARESKGLPNLLVVITGKGPLQKYYLQAIAALNQKKKLEKVVIQTAYLPHSDYARLLACADLGVCLHHSSSGLDLPMKVADMFGAGLPVVAWSGYEAFAELIEEGESGVGFENADALSKILSDLLGSSGGQKLSRLKAGAMKEGKMRWDEAWDQTAAKTFNLVEP